MSDRPPEDGFEYKLPDDQEATFFRWAVSDGAKDLMLIDRFTGMPVQEFFAVIEDNFDRGRSPILLALLATSIRAKFPDWSVERVARTVQNIPSLSDIQFVDADVEESELPPTSGGHQEPPTVDSSTSPSDALRPSVIPAESSSSETSAVTLV